MSGISEIVKNLQFALEHAKKVERQLISDRSADTKDELINGLMSENERLKDQLRTLINKHAIEIEKKDAEIDRLRNNGVSTTYNYTPTTIFNGYDSTRVPAPRASPFGRVSNGLRIEEVEDRNNEPMEPRFSLANSSRPHDPSLEWTFGTGRGAMVPIQNDKDEFLNKNRRAIYMLAELEGVTMEELFARFTIRELKGKIGII